MAHVTLLAATSEPAALDEVAILIDADLIHDMRLAQRQAVVRQRNEQAAERWRNRMRGRAHATANVQRVAAIFKRLYPAQLEHIARPGVMTQIIGGPPRGVLWSQWKP